MEDQSGVNPMLQCPRFERCSVNHCPLDIEKDEHLPCKFDKEKVCTINKKLRMRIGSKLKNIGLKAQELAQMKIHHPNLFENV